MNCNLRGSSNKKASNYLSIHFFAMSINRHNFASLVFAIWHKFWSSLRKGRPGQARAKKWQMALLALEQFTGQTCGSCEFCFLSILMPFDQNEHEYPNASSQIFERMKKSRGPHVWPVICTRVKSAICHFFARAWNKQKFFLTKMKLYTKNYNFD